MDKKALNRRQFLGKALKVLPIIAMIPFYGFSSTVENFASSFSKASTSCNGSCSGSCHGDCSGDCDSGCSGRCGYACSGGCSSNCGGAVVRIVLKSALVIASELVVMAVRVTVKKPAVEHVEVNVLRTVRAIAIFNVQNNVQHSVEMGVNQCAPKDVEQVAVKDALTGVLLCHNFEKQCHSI